MNIKNYTSSLLIGCALILIQSCKCDDPSDSSCPNFDPCLSVNEDFANFKMEEKISRFDIVHLIETDTTLENNLIHFSIRNTNVDSVKWKIGNEVEYRIGNKTDVLFEEPFGELNIVCIAYSNKAKSCGVSSIGIDTARKTLHVLNWWEGKYFGTFEGSSTVDSDVDFFTSIDTFSYYNGSNINEDNHILHMSNFPNGYTMPFPEDGLQKPYQPYTVFSYNGFVLINADEISNCIALFNNRTKALNAEFGFSFSGPRKLQKYSGKMIN